MGLINYLQDEEERVTRRAGQQVDRVNRNVGLLQTEMAPHQKTVEKYNSDAELYNGGWYGNGKAYYAPYANTGGYAKDWYFEQGGDSVAFVGSPPPEYSNKQQVGTISSQNFPLYVFNKYAKPDQSAATASNDFLTSQESRIDGLNRRGEIVQRNVGRETERLQTEIDLNRRRAIEEEAMSRQPNAGSVLDQNMAGVFTSISDWLKG